MTSPPSRWMESLGALAGFLFLVFGMPYVAVAAMIGPWLLVRAIAARFNITLSGDMFGVIALVLGGLLLATAVLSWIPRRH
jgi:hypothetical protein